MMTWDMPDFETCIVLEQMPGRRALVSLIDVWRLGGYFVASCWVVRR